MKMFSLLCLFCQSWGIAISVIPECFDWLKVALSLIKYLIKVHPGSRFRQKTNVKIAVKKVKIKNFHRKAPASSCDELGEFI